MLVYGGLMKPQQRKLFRNALTLVVGRSPMIKPVDFEMREFIEELCTFSRDIPMPESAELS
jgi:hypothetical protein